MVKVIDFGLAKALHESLTDKSVLNHEPVRAAAPSIFYLFRKMVRRHRVAIATAVSFLALLLGSAVVSSLLAVQARREAGKSRQQTDRAEQALLAAATARDRADRERTQADQSRAQAEADRDRALTEAYINAIRRSYLNARHADGNEQVRFDLGRWVPAEGETDRRGWEWFLLNSQQFGNERFLHGHTTSVADVACSPDGKRLVSLDEAGLIVIWDVPSGQILVSHLADDVQGTAVAWSPTGAQLATAGIGGTIKIWSVAETVKVVRVLVRHNEPVRDLAFNPRGDRNRSRGRSPFFRRGYEKPLALQFFHTRLGLSGTVLPRLDGSRPTGADRAGRFSKKAWRIVWSAATLLTDTESCCRETDAPLHHPERNTHENEATNESAAAAGRATGKPHRAVGCRTLSPGGRSRSLRQR